MPWQIDERLASFISVTEVERGAFFADALFRRKFGRGVSRARSSRHCLLSARRDNVLPASYLHLWTQRSIGLVGGGCTDGAVLRAMTDDQRARINAAGGLLRQTLGYCFARFEADLEAYFGHCGDARAKEVDLAAGFLETGVRHLLFRPNRPLAPERQRELLAQAQSIGAF